MPFPILHFKREMKEGRNSQLLTYEELNNLSGYEEHSEICDCAAFVVGNLLARNKKNLIKIRMIVYLKSFIMKILSPTS